MASEYLIVNKKILPENVLLVVEANKLITEQKLSISDACKSVGISRGTYYKYHDSVFLPSEEFGKKAIFTFILEHNNSIEQYPLEIHITPIASGFGSRMH